MKAADSKYKGLSMWLILKFFSKKFQIGSVYPWDRDEKSSNVLYEYAVPVPKATKVSMLNSLEDWNNFHDRVKNSRPARKTTGVHKANWRTKVKLLNLSTFT